MRYASANTDFSNVTDTTVRFHIAELKTEQIIEGFWLAQASIATLDFVSASANYHVTEKIKKIKHYRTFQFYK